MKRRLFAVLTAALAAFFITASLSGCGEPESSSETETTEATTAAVTETTTEDSTVYPVPPTPPEPPTSGDTEDEEMDFFETFPDFPTHFVTHGGRPGEENSNEHYLHATIELSGDGTMTGELFTNLESTETETVEHKSSWTGKIKDNRLYRDTEGTYYIILDDIKYEHEPKTSETVDGKTVNYVYGFGLDPETGNRLEVFTPETEIDSLKVENSQQDIRQFLSMMHKDGEADTLGCYLLRGRVDNCYVSITDEEANMAPPEQPEQPE